MNPPRTATIDVGTGIVPIAQRTTRQRVFLVSNVGALPAWIGFDNAVSQTTGYELAPGADLVATFQAAWYAVSSGAGTTLSIIDDTT